jgi:hypothetical protein
MLLFLFGCAHQLGEEAAKGAIESTQKETQKGQAAGQPPLFKQAGEDATSGALATLANPKQQALLGEIAANTLVEALRGATGQRSGTGGSGAAGMKAGPAGQGRGAATGVGGTGPGGNSPVEVVARQAGRALARSFSGELVRQLGPNGSGPLGQSMSALAGRSSSSALQSAGATLALFPECTGADRSRCVQDRINLAAQEAARGAMVAALAPHRIWLVGGAFAAGVIAAVVIGWAVVVLRRLRKPAAIARRS